VSGPRFQVTRAECWWPFSYIVAFIGMRMVSRRQFGKADKSNHSGGLGGSLLHGLIAGDAG
jgi:hypothetical protein